MVELSVILAVILLLLVAAGPGFSDALREWRLNTEINRLATTIENARLDAITLNAMTVVCPAIPHQDSVTCAGDDAGDWSGGYIAFRDNDRNHRFDPRRDQVLARKSAVATGLRLRLANALALHNRLQFMPDGRLRGGSAGIFSLCHPKNLMVERGLMVNLTGQVQRMSRDTVSKMECVTGT